jgi:thioredoxin-dependent peroxiredoxin
MEQRVYLAAVWIQQMLKIGQKAPDFKLKTDNGNDLSLKEFAGRRVVLFFFPKANTPG